MGRAEGMRASSLALLLIAGALAVSTHGLENPEEVTGDGLGSSLGEGAVPYDKQSPVKKTLTSKQIWKAAKKGDVENVKKALDGVSKSGATRSKASTAKSPGLDVSTVQDGIKNAMECKLMKSEMKALQSSKEYLTTTNAKLEVDRTQLKKTAQKLEKENDALRAKMSGVQITEAKEAKLVRKEVKLVATDAKLASSNAGLKAQLKRLQQAQAESRTQANLQRSSAKAKDAEIARMKTAVSAAAAKHASVAADLEA